MALMQCAVVSTLAMLLVCPAAPAVAAGAVWGQVVVPGGVPAARRVLELGESMGRFDASLATDFTYRRARTGDWSRAEEKLRRYLANVDVIARIVGDAPKAIAPPAPGAPKADVERFRELCAALGIERRKIDAQWRYVPGTSPASRERVEWATALGLDVAAMANAWTSGGAEAIPLATDILPVPLPAFWPAGSSVRLSLDDLVRDRTTGLFYTALMGLDDGTLAWFDAHPEVLRRLRAQSVSAFAAFSRSLRVNEAAVVTPGGPAMTPAWARLTGQSASEPVRFLPALLTIDDGLLAYFFDAVFHASSSVRAAIDARVAQRPAAIDDIYRAFRESAGAWSVDARPFDRPMHDPAWTLSLLELPDGRIGGPAWLPVVLERAVSDTAWPGRPLTLPSRVPAGDVDWTIRWIFERPGDQLERVKLLRFAQRLERLDVASPDAAEAALRTFRTMPALAIALERMGIHDAEVIAQAGRSAYALSRAGDRKAIEPVVARWQSSLALVEQVARLRHLPARTTTPLVLALADAAARPPREVTDRLLHWTTDALLPALTPRSGAIAIDRDSLARLASADPATRQKVVWEGLTYDRNPLRIARRDLDALTAPPAVVAHNDVATLEPLHDRLDQGLRSPDDARKMATDLDVIRMNLARPAAIGPQGDDRFSRELAAAARGLRSDPPIAKGGPPPAPDLEVSNVFGAAADRTIQPVVYALAMTPLHGAPSLQREAWTFHELADSAAREDWWQRAWEPATQEPRIGGGSGLVGSWLLLDLSLGESIVPRRFDRADGVATPVLDAIFHDIALRAQPLDAQIDALADDVGRLARGRAIIAEWQRDAAAGGTLMRSDPRASALSPSRRNFLSWSLGRSGEAAMDLSLSEIASLGGAPRLTALALDSCACVADAPAWSLEDVRPYWMAGVSSAYATDLPLRIAEVLTEAHLPLQLVADILPLAAADWLSHVNPYANDDWESLTLWPKRLTLAEIEGYVMQLLSDGILTPLDEAVP